MKTIVDAWKENPGKDLWFYLEDDEMINLFQKQYLDLADQIGVKKELLKKLKKYPLSHHVKLVYSSLADYTNLNKSLSYGTKAFPNVAYIDFKKFISNESYYFVQEKTSFKKNISITFDRNLYDKLFDFCLRNQIAEEDAIIKILENRLSR